MTGYNGGVSVTGLGSNIYRRINYTTGAFRCRILGVDGVLTMGAGPAWTFTRDSSGSVVVVPNPVRLEISSNVIENSTSVASANQLAQMQNSLVVIWGLFSDITDNTDLETALDRISMITRACCKNTFVVVGEMAGGSRLTVATAGQTFPVNASSDQNSQDLIERTITYNNRLAAAFPNRFLDLANLLKSNNHTQVVSVLGKSYDIVKTSFLPDGIHPDNVSAGILAGWIRDFIVSKGL